MGIVVIIVVTGTSVPFPMEVGNIMDTIGTFVFIVVPSFELVGFVLIILENEGLPVRPVTR